MGFTKLIGVRQNMISDKDNFFLSQILSLYSCINEMCTIVLNHGPDAGLIQTCNEDPNYKCVVNLFAFAALNIN